MTVAINSRVPAKAFSKGDPITWVLTSSDQFYSNFLLILIAFNLVSSKSQTDKYVTRKNSKTRIGFWRWSHECFNSWNTSSKTCIALFRYEIADLDCLAVAKKETNFLFARYLIWIHKPLTVKSRSVPSWRQRSEWRWSSWPERPKKTWPKKLTTELQVLKILLFDKNTFSESDLVCFSRFSKSGFRNVALRNAT